jgi:hypothetical protein
LESRRRYGNNGAHPAIGNQEGVALDRRRDLVFYRLVVPTLAAANVVLAGILVSNLQPTGWLEWLEVATAGFCCGVAGWLGASLWSKSYWAQVIARQVAAWRRMADTILEWIEDLPIPSESVEGLKRSLEDTRR